MADPYVYAPLDLSKDSIRLIRLCKGYPGTNIRCEILESYLSESEGVPYEALSYTWGGVLTDDSPCVLLDGHKFPVTENLYEGLCSLRLGNMDRFLWIDALCINQKDHREKGHQVGQMRHVYQNAESVLIWLGPSSEDIDRLMRMMVVCGKLSSGLQRTPPDLKLIPIKTVAKLLGIDSAVYRKCMSALKSLCQRRWFKRVWIIQEVASARAATILCGSNSVSSNFFSTMPSLMDVEIDSHAQAVLDVMPGPLRKQSWWNEDRRLVTLLWKFHGSEASQEHDRIYALLGIASDAPNIPIDYGCPFQQVVDRTVSVLTLRDASLSRLLYKGSTFVFPEVFLGLTDANDFIIRVLELASRHSEEIFLKHLTDSPVISTIATDARIDGIFQLALTQRDHFICHRISEIDGYVPSIMKFGRYLPYISHLGFERMVKRMHAKDPKILNRILPDVARSGDGQQMQILLDHGVDIGKILYPNLLYHAFNHKNSKTLRFILERHKIVAAEEVPCTTDLLWKAFEQRRKDAAPLNTLIDYAADIDKPRNGLTLLHAAIKYGCSSTVRRLAERGAKLSFCDKLGDSPLHLAELTGDKKVIAILLVNGADEFAKNHEGLTPYQLRHPRQKRRNKNEMERLLSDAGEKNYYLYAGLLEGRDDDERDGTEDRPKKAAPEITLEQALTSRNGAIVMLQAQLSEKKNASPAQLQSRTRACPQPKRKGVSVEHQSNT